MTTFYDIKWSIKHIKIESIDSLMRKFTKDSLNALEDDLDCEFECISSKCGFRPSDKTENTVLGTKIDDQCFVDDVMMLTMKIVKMSRPTAFLQKLLCILTENRNSMGSLRKAHLVEKMVSFADTFLHAEQTVQLLVGKILSLIASDDLNLMLLTLKCGEFALAMLDKYDEEMLETGLNLVALVKRTIPANETVSIEVVGNIEKYCKWKCDYRYLAEFIRCVPFVIPMITPSSVVELAKIRCFDVVVDILHENKAIAENANVVTTLSTIDSDCFTSDEWKMFLACWCNLVDTNNSATKQETFQKIRHKLVQIMFEREPIISWYAAFVLSHDTRLEKSQESCIRQCLEEWITHGVNPVLHDRLTERLRAL